MSWSLQIDPVDASAFPSACHVALAEAASPDTANAEQRDRAVAAAAAMVAAGAVGIDCMVTANLSGHANPAHDATKGAAETITVTVSYAGPNPDPVEVAERAARAAEAAAT